MKIPSTDLSLWTRQRAFGPAGGPDIVTLTHEGLSRAFSRGASVRSGPPAEALEALSVAGGAGLLSARSGARLTKTELGRFDQIAWGRLRELGYVESVDPDGVRLTAKGREAVAAGYAEREALLDRCRRVALRGTWILLHGLTERSFPTGKMRYSVISRDDSQDPSITDHGCSNSFESARRQADKMIPDAADRVEIWDGVRGYLVAIKEVE